MNRRKIAPVLLTEDENENHEQKPIVNLVGKKNNKKGMSKWVIRVSILMALGYFAHGNKEEIKDFLNSQFNGDSPINIEMPVFNSDNSNTNENVKSEANNMANDMRAVMANKNSENNSPVFPEVNIADSSSTSPAPTHNEDSNEFPTVSFPNSESNTSSTPPILDNSNAGRTPPPPNNIDNPTASNTASNENSNEMLSRELNMLLKNSEFKINAKKDNISLFISNINYNVGETILNSQKFKLNAIRTLCENGRMPTFEFEITDNNDNSLLVKQVKYSDGKKVSLGFDSLSITDIGSNTESIYLPKEQIFKGFTLKDIKDKGNLLSFEFSCNGNTFIIDGEELSTIY